MIYLYNVILFASFVCFNCWDWKTALNERSKKFAFLRLVLMSIFFVWSSFIGLVYLCTLMGIT